MINTLGISADHVSFITLPGIRSLYILLLCLLLSHRLTFIYLPSLGRGKSPSSPTNDEVYSHRCSLHPLHPGHRVDTSRLNWPRDDPPPAMDIRGQRRLPRHSHPNQHLRGLPHEWGSRRRDLFWLGSPPLHWSVHHQLLRGLWSYRLAQDTIAHYAQAPRTRGYLEYQASPR